MKTSRIIQAILTLVAMMTLTAVTARAQFAVLHHFAIGNDDGGFPYGSPTLSGSTLYGMTSAGGKNDYGTVFKMKGDGSGYAILHSFGVPVPDHVSAESRGRAFPYGSPTLSGSTLYGMTLKGGSRDYGTIFRMNCDGSGYTILHAFAGGKGDGMRPNGTLTLSGSVFYGMTQFGGRKNNGVVFKINSDGSGYTNLHSFAGGSNDGRNPLGSLTLSGSRLYGMTLGGGRNDKGVVFKMNADGSRYTILHSFAGGKGDGGSPYGSLTLSGSTLYGMTAFNGSGNQGVVFKINTDGRGYSILHSFAGGRDGGSCPVGSLTLCNSALYGMTEFGGRTDRGVIFKINTDGSGYSIVHTFAGGRGDGRGPLGSLVLLGNSLYGMTCNGGNNGNGVVFKLEIVP
ncbi:MAG: choice-of-anchor tandem repeat GloVer-containing protein [Verrucomicrobiia bacterium]